MLIKVVSLQPPTAYIYLKVPEADVEKTTEAIPVNESTKVAPKGFDACDVQTPIDLPMPLSTLNDPPHAIKSAPADGLAVTVMKAVSAHPMILVRTAPYTPSDVKPDTKGVAAVVEEKVREDGLLESADQVPAPVPDITTVLNWQIDLSIPAFGFAFTIIVVRE